MEKIFHKINNYFSSSWRLAVLDINKGRWLVKSNTLSICYLKAENANGRHILMQPSAEIEPYYILADDLNSDILKAYHMKSDNSWRPGRMVVKTSPGNYQVWIHSNRKLSLNEKKYWLKRLKSDPGAGPKNRWGRCPGFRNRKDKYRTDSDLYPLAKLIWVDWAQKVDIPILSLNTKKHQPVKKYHLTRNEKYKHSICRHNYERGNESITDFSYALALARRGETAEFIESKIFSERQNWDNHIGEKRIRDYLKRTVKKAIDIIKAS